jgi:hypothetical protein
MAPDMTGQSVVPDYISVILRAIEKAKNDPAQLRQLVYDIARIGLGRQILINYREIGSAGLQQQLADLESAIRQVETLARMESELIPFDAQAPRLSDPASARNNGIVSVRDSAAGARAALAQVYRQKAADSEFSALQVWEPVVSESAKAREAARFRKFELPIAVLLGFAIYAAMLVRSDYFGGLSISFLEHTPRLSLVAPAAAPASGTGTAPWAVPAPHPKPLDFPLPSIYGVYAISGGKLYELEPLAMKVPDPRVAISAMISNASRVTVPNGKIRFVVYRRDLASSAPDTISIRVVAQVMREIKFAGNGPPTTTEVDGEWAIRNKAFDFGVAPISGEDQMIMVRPSNPQFSFPAGRYVFVFRGEGYDFKVAGQLTDMSQCLERTDALGGIVYSECRAMP